MSQYLETEVFPEAVRNQAFGSDLKKFIKFIPSDRKSVDHFAADVLFGDVVLENASGQTVEESVVIKSPPTNEGAHDLFVHDAFFNNEVLFYAEVIPLLKKYDTDGVLTANFPEFVFGKATNGVNPQKDIIVLKNLNSKGFQLTQDRLFLDEKHVTMVLEKVAKYHALSLKCLSKEPEAFNKVASKLRKYLREDLGKPLVDFVALGSVRGIEALEKDPDYKDRLGPLRNNFARGRFWRQKYWSPSETLNVVAHGDFGCKNMMFKYGDDGQPIDVVFFDMAAIKYCSPMVDVRPFLIRQTSPEVKRAHWDNFLKTYYKSFSSQLGGVAEKPSFEQMDLDLRTKSVLGYHGAAFHFPLMIQKWQKEDFASKNHDTDKIFEEMMNFGGEEVTALIADIIKFMIDRDFIFEQ